MAQESSPPPTAALLVIGNELLSGKITDQNTPYLASQLFNMGWDFKEVCMIGDSQADIVTSLQRLLKKYDHVFTSGGVGPTHDDITLQAVGVALNRKLVLSPVLERLLKKFYKTEVLSPAQQRLAMIPEGAVLHYGSDSLYPQMVVERVYPLPGIPNLFRKKFQELKEMWPQVAPPARRCFQMIAMETDLAALLGALAVDHPKVSLGSYPTERDGIWHLELVMESRDGSALEGACGALRKVLEAREIEWKECG